MGGIFFSALQDLPTMALVALGFYISLRLMRFPDLSTDASYMFGMSAVGWAIASTQLNEIAALPLALVFGALIGFITGWLHTSEMFGLSKLLAGLLVSFAAYSICFRLIDNQTPLNLYPFKDQMFFYPLINSRDWQNACSILLVFAFYLVAARLMNTSFGYGIRSVGHRRDIVTSLGIHPNTLLIGGLAFSNMLIAAAGWMTATNTTNVALENFGMVVHALAAVLIGEFGMFIILWVVGGKAVGSSVATQRIHILLLTPLVGALLYAFIKATVIHALSGQLRIAVTTDFQLVLSLIILATVALGRKLAGKPAEEMDDAL